MATCKFCGKAIYWPAFGTVPNPRPYNDAQLTDPHDCRTTNTKDDTEIRANSLLTSHKNVIVNEVSLLLQKMGSDLRTAFTEVITQIGRVQEIVVSNMASMTKSLLKQQKTITEMSIVLAKIHDEARI